MPAFDQLQPAQFLQIRFPISRVSVEGGIRDHVHEYPHTSGGSVEKMGRKLYSIKMDAWFATNIPGYPDLWPLRLGELRAHFDSQITGNLVIPTIGSIMAYAVSWTQNQEVRHRSGETFAITFREDQPPLDELGFNFNPLALTNAGINMAAAAEVLPVEKRPSLIARIEEAIDDVLSKRDTVDVFAATITARLERIAHYCDLLDGLLTKPDPELMNLVNAVHDVWASATKLARDLTGTDSFRVYQVTRLMSVTDLSRALYNGDGTRGMDIMQMNPIEDPFAVPAGTRIKYFAD